MTDQNTAIRSMPDRQILDQVPASSLAAPAALVPQNMGQAMEMAKIMAAGDIGVPKHMRGKPAICLRIITDAMQFGLNPFHLASESYVVSDMLAYGAKAIHAMLMRSGILQGRLKVEYAGEGVNLVCTVTGTIEGYKHAKVVHIKDIRTKNSPLWATDPQQQLGYYTERAWVRLFAPDAILGLVAREDPPIDITPEPGAVSAVEQVKAQLIGEHVEPGESREPNLEREPSLEREPEVRREPDEAREPTSPREPYQEREPHTMREPQSLREPSPMREPSIQREPKGGREPSEQREPNDLRDNAIDPSELTNADKALVGDTLDRMAGHQPEGPIDGSSLSYWKTHGDKPKVDPQMAPFTDPDYDGCSDVADEKPAHMDSIANTNASEWHDFDPDTGGISPSEIFVAQAKKFYEAASRGMEISDFKNENKDHYAALSDDQRITLKTAEDGRRLALRRRNP